MRDALFLRFRLAVQFVLASSFVLGLLVTCSSVPAFAQTQPPPSFGEGFNPYGSFEGGDIDIVNVKDGLLNVRIPLVSYPQRGANLHANFYIIYKDTNYNATVNNNTRTTTYSLDPRSGIQIVSDIAPYYYHSTLNLTTYGSVAEPDGTTHPLEGGTQYQGVTVDGSAYTALYSAPSIPPCPIPSTPQIDFHDLVTDKRGVRYSFNCLANFVSALDPNGNKITGNVGSLPNGNLGFVSWTDSLGRVIPTPPVAQATVSQWGSTTDFSGCTGALPTQQAFLWTIPSLAGGSATYKVCMAGVTINLPNCSGASHCQTGAGAQRIQSIVLPNGKAWTFQWDSAAPGSSSFGFGNLVGIEFPTAGSISYKWLTGSGPQPGTVQTRTINANDSIGPQTTSYSFPAPACCSNPPYTTTSTDPLQNDIAHTFTALGGCAYYENITQYYQGTGSTRALLKTVQTDYQFSLVDTTCVSNYAGPYDSQTINIFPIRFTTTWPNGQVTKTERDYLFDVTFPASGEIPTSYGNIVAQREYDYASGGPGPLLRTTNYSFLYQSSANYKSANIVALPCLTTVYGPGSVPTQTSCSAPAVQANQAAQTVYGYDENNGSPQGVLGNPTSATRWFNGGTSPKSQTVFNTQGMPTKKIDPKGNATQITYDATGAFPSQIQFPTTAVAHIETFSYDGNTGLLTSHTDQNSQSTSYHYDSLLRPTQVNYPDSGQITNCYTDLGGSSCVQSAPPYQMVTTRTASPSPNQIRTTVFDGFGRVTQTQLNSDSNGANATDYVDTTYDAVGRVHSVSNPHRSGSSSTDGTTRYIYDAIGRVCVIVPTDGTSVSSCPATRPTGDIFTIYVGNITTVTDEAGKTRKSQTDGLGRLTNVWEDPSFLNYQTVYSYDPLGNLTGVVQNGSRSRSFGYDSIARLTSAMNPESGAISYTYDANDNVATRIAPAPNQTGSATVTTTYSYDALNRLTGKVYSDTTPVYANGTPTALWGYDQTSTLMCAPQSFAVPYGIGRLSWSTPVDQNGIPLSMTAYGYDQMGRTALFYQCPPLFSNGHQDAHVSYTYDAAGNLRTALNGANVTISYSNDGAGRPAQATSSLQDANHPGTLVTVDPSLGYWPTGSLHTLTYGNGLTETNAYNKRIQPCRYNLNSSGTSLNACTDTIPSGNLQDLNYAVNLGTANNGNMAQITATGTQTFNRSFSYDNVNRLQAMTDSVTSQQCRGLSWTYDPWANRTSQVPTAGSCFQQPVTTFSSKNQLPPPYQYDAAGNVIADGSHTYTYDAENRIIKVDGGATATYVYNADGLRTEKRVGSTVRDYVYDVTGEVVSEFGPTCSATCWNAGYIYFGGQFAAEYRNATTYFVHKDHLGSTRLLTAVDKSIADSIDYLPFGEQIAGGTGSSHKFTGKERDVESGLDDFEARYMSSSMGRFTSPDPDNVSGLMNQDNPQSWNGYSYALNNPLRYTDPDGQDVRVCIDGQSECHNYTDKQYQSLLDAQNGKQGINLPNQGLPTGDITCGGVKCGTATYFEPGLDPSDNFTIVGGIAGARGAGAIVSIIRSAADALSALFEKKEPPPPAANQGAYGTASRVQDLNGLSRQDADAALRAQNPAKVHTTKGGYTQYKFEDGSTIWVRPNGEVVRVPAPGTAPAGSRISPGGNLTDAHNTGEKVGP